MEAILEALLQCILELLLQVFGEFLWEIGIRGALETMERSPVRNPFLAGVGYFLFGAIVGGLSLLLVRNHFIQNSTLRMLNLFLAPILAGLIMTGLGAYRAKKGQTLVRLDRFGYGALFAFGTTLVRFLFALKPA